MKKIILYAALTLSFAPAVDAEDVSWGQYLELMQKHYIKDTFLKDEWVVRFRTTRLLNYAMCLGDKMTVRLQKVCDKTKCVGKLSQPFYQKLKLESHDLCIYNLTDETLN